MGKKTNYGDGIGQNIEWWWRQLCHLPELEFPSHWQNSSFNEVKPHVLKEARNIADCFKRMHRRIKRHTVPFLYCFHYTGGLWVQGKWISKCPKQHRNKIQTIEEFSWEPLSVHLSRVSERAAYGKQREDIFSDSDTNLWSPHTVMASTSACTHVCTHWKHTHTHTPHNDISTLIKSRCISCK